MAGIVTLGKDRKPVFVVDISVPIFTGLAKLPNSSESCAMKVVPIGKLGIGAYLKDRLVEAPKVGETQYPVSGAFKVSTEM